jgi:hypothetical protein
MARATATSWRWTAGQPAHAAGGVLQRDAQLGQQRRGGRVEAGLGPHQPPRLLAEHDVRRDVQVVAQRQVLPDHGESLPGRAARIRWHPLAAEVDFAAGRDHVAGDAAHQGGLARAVLARQRDQLTALHGQVDVGQGAEPAVAQVEPGHGQQRRGVIFRVGPGFHVGRRRHADVPASIPAGASAGLPGRDERTGHAVIVWPQSCAWPQRSLTMPT